VSLAFEWTFSENAINRRAADLERSSNLRGAKALGLQFAHPCGFYRRRAAFVDASSLRLGDTFKLAFTPQVGLELGEYAEHIEEAFAGGGACVDRLFRGLQDCATSPYSSYDVLQIADATRQTIDTSDHQHVTLRHACGYALANRGHDTRALQAYLGHRNIQHTVRYTELSPARFKNFWRE
jgi:Phage integrase family